MSTLTADAKQCIEYYQRLAKSEDGSRWLLGLYMSQQWLKYLQQPEHDLSELKLFLQALEAERQNQGSGWSDLWSRVRNWVATLEEAQLS